MIRWSSSHVLSRLFRISALASVVFDLLALSSTTALATEPIRSASELDYPPFAMVTKDNRADGFAVEMLRESLRAMGRDVQFEVGPWHKIKQDLAEGRIQVLPLVARTDERQAHYDFTAPYLSLHGSVVVRKGDSRIRRAEDLNGKVIVAMKGDSAEEYVRRFRLSDIIATTATLEEALRQLAAGQHDAMVVQTLAGETLIRDLGLSNLEIVGLPLAKYHDFCFAVRKGNSELLSVLNEGLSHVVADGTRERLREKWITPTRDEQDARVLHLVLTVFGSLLFAGTGAFLWQRTLRAQVKARTEALAIANKRQQEEIESRQQAESNLRESEEGLAITLHSIGDAVIATDAEGCVTRMNPTAERLTGWILDEARGRPLPDVFRIVNADTRQTVANPVQRVMECGEVVGLANHTVLLARDGQEYQIADSAAPIRNAAKKIIGVVLVFSDVSEKYAMEQAVRDNERSLQESQRIAGIGSYTLNISTGLWTSSEVFDQTFGIDESYDRSVEGWVAMIHPEDRAMMANYFKDEILTQGHPFDKVYRIVRQSDQVARWAHGLGRLEFDALNRPVTMYGTIQDITDRKLVDEALQTSEKRYRAIFQTSADVINIIRLSDGCLVDANQSFLDIHGYERDEVIGHTSSELNVWFDPVERQRFVEILQRDSKCSNLEARFRRRNGELIWGLVSASVVELDGTPCIVSIRRDITGRKQAEAKIHDLAFFDQLTGLPNRTLLLDRLGQAIASSLRSGSYGALLLIDLDSFKTINDTLGHDMGDRLLKQVAQRLTECVREEDTVARLGGDEFVVILANLSDSQSEAASRVELIGHKISAVLNQTYEVNDVCYRISPSIGASVFLGHLTGIDTILKQADIAMYRAKATGRNVLRFFDPAMALDVLKRVSLENDLRAAVQMKQFVLHYQVQVTGTQVTGAEALLRWQCPERGLVFPGEFISVIEETGLILPIGQWVLDIVCKQLSDWATQPEMSHITVAVNISARQLNNEDFVDQVLLALDRHGTDPRRLKLELTESLLVTNVEDTIGKMTALKAKGVRFSLDDFGTGYSSLLYLKRLPLDQLKIDQSFVRDILTDPNDAAIARMIVVLAESLGLAVIAEGVETEAQRDSLTQHGCHAYQGYLFSRPLPVDEFESYVKRV